MKSRRDALYKHLKQKFMEKLAKITFQCKFNILIFFSGRQISDGKGRNSSGMRKIHCRSN